MRTVSVLASVTALVSGATTLPVLAQQRNEARYIAARDSAIKSLVARTGRGERYPKYIPAHDSALVSLGRLLRLIIGPVQVNGFSRSGRINLRNLFPEDEGFGKLDALVFRGDDQKSVLWVTTRSLVQAWVAQQDSAIARDLEAAYRKPEFYTAAIEAGAAVYGYASISLADAQRLGVVHAFMIRIGQDDSALPPDELLVTVARGRMVYIVRAPVGVIISPPHRCTAIRDSLQKQAERSRQQYVGSQSVDTAALRRAEHDGDGAELAYRECYGERARLNPAFAKVVAQVHSIVAGLP
jgi:hypothetical protein